MFTKSRKPKHLSLSLDRKYKSVTNLKNNQQLEFKHRRCLSKHKSFKIKTVKKVNHNKITKAKKNYQS